MMSISMLMAMKRDSLPGLCGWGGAHCRFAGCAGPFRWRCLTALVDGCLAWVYRGGDIGTFFPDSDPALDNVNSAVLLDTVLEHVQKANVHITHVDLTVIAQIPKVGPHREMIRRNVARLLGLDMGAVNVKATTEEGLGFTGERLGIKAVAVVTGLRGNRDA